MTRMEFGVFLDLETERTTIDAHLERYVPSLQLAERLRFRSVWAGESYPGPSGGYQHVPSPMLVLAALTQRCGLGIGTGVILLPAWNPLKLAYDATMLDQLSGGHFSLGVGMGNAAMWRQFGADPTTVGDRADEMLQAVRALWRGDPGYTGAYVSIAGPIGPPPVTPGGPPIWIGGKIKRSARRAAEFGDGLLAGTHFRWPLVRSLIDEYRSSLGDLGHDPAAGQISVNRIMILAEDSDTAWRDSIAFVGPLMRRWAKLGMLHGVTVDDLTDEAGVKEAARGVCIVGSPETAAAELETLALSGVTHLQVRPAPWGAPAALVDRTLELVGRHLIPLYE